MDEFNIKIIEIISASDDVTDASNDVTDAAMMSLQHPMTSQTQPMQWEAPKMSSMHTMMSAAFEQSANASKNIFF